MDDAHRFRYVIESNIFHMPLSAMSHDHPNAIIMEHLASGWVLACRPFHNIIRLMKSLWPVFLIMMVGSTLADTPTQIAADYRKEASAAVQRLNETLEKAATPLVANLVAKGDLADAEQLAEQLKAKLAGGQVLAPHSSAALLFAQYDQARSKALEPVRKAAMARIEKMLLGSETSSLETITALAKVRAEVEDIAKPSPPSVRESHAADSNPTPPPSPATNQVARLVNERGGKYTNVGDGKIVTFNRASLSAEDIKQICSERLIKVFSWNGGSGLTDEGLAAFGQLKKLEELNLWAAGNITDDGLNHLAGCEKLWLLNIGANGSGITGTGFEALSACKSLRQLTLNMLPGLEGKNLRHLSKLQSLANLRLSACKGVMDDDIDWISQMKNLTHLHVGNTSVTSSGIAKLVSLKHLEELVVSASLVNEPGVQAVIKACPKVKVVPAN